MEYETVDCNCYNELVSELESVKIQNQAFKDALVLLSDFYAEDHNYHSEDMADFVRSTARLALGVEAE
jgi:hypothetical protein